MNSREDRIYINNVMKEIGLQGKTKIYFVSTQGWVVQCPGI